VKAQYGIDLPATGSDGTCEVKVGAPLLVVLGVGVRGTGWQQPAASSSHALLQLRGRLMAMPPRIARTITHTDPPCFALPLVMLAPADFPAAL
jgi:hypothetical protein